MKQECVRKEKLYTHTQTEACIADNCSPFITKLKWSHFWGLCLFSLSQMDGLKLQLATQRINIVTKSG